MNQQNTQKLFNDFSFFYPERPATEALMCFGFECGDGWYDLIYRLCEDIKAVNPPETFSVFQVKEKFGGLRFYVDGATDEIYNLINKAESDSYRICEQCGAEAGGPKKIKGWVRTLCEQCETGF